MIPTFVLVADIEFWLVYSMSPSVVTENGLSSKTSPFSWLKQMDTPIRLNESIDMRVLVVLDRAFICFCQLGFSLVGELGVAEVEGRRIAVL